MYAENYDTVELKRWYEQMEKYITFLNWKNQYSENDYFTQSNL